MTARTILVVDDDPAVMRVIEGSLRSGGYEVVCAPSAEDGLRVLDARPVDAIVTDMKMPGMSGTTFVGEVRKRFDDVPVIVVTAFPSVESAVEAMRAGAYDYLQKPFRHADLLFSLEKALVAHGGDAAATSADAEGEIVSRSPKMTDVEQLVGRVARTDATVLVLGETGAGKEVVARAIHERSPRAARPFLKVHCAALPETLLESELFGYERGAFTGAVTRKPGRLELAEGGTLFLDEIGDVTAATQVKLLRVLQDRQYERVGGTKTLVADVRIVAATHRDLDAMRADGRFRDDLFFRLHVFPIRVPPLRDRRDDIPDLARHLLARASAYAEGPITLAPDALEALAAHDWPGNVREMAHLLERLVILVGRGTIRAAQVESALPPARRAAPVSAPPSAPAADLAAARAVGERAAIEDAMTKAKGNRTYAAKLLGVSRRTLYTKLLEHGLVSGVSA